MRWRKVLGLAGFAGVAAAGVLIAKDERRRRAYSSHEVRERLHERLAQAAASKAVDAPPAEPLLR